jgi:acetolactate synthase small subunit
MVVKKDTCIYQIRKQNYRVIKVATVRCTNYKQKLIKRYAPH